MNRWRIALLIALYVGLLVLIAVVKARGDVRPSTGGLFWR